jgi:RNA polymerase primary sigma factor
MKKVRQQGGVAQKKQAIAVERTRVDAGAGEPLAQYMSDLQVASVLDAEQEIKLAQEIERLEVAHYRALLSHEAGYAILAQALKEHLTVPRELGAIEHALHRSALRSVHKAPERKRRTSPLLSRIEALARNLRELDAGRTGLPAADAAVREQLAGTRTPAIRSYLSRVATARAAHQAAKNRFVTANLRLVVAMARRYEQSLLPLSDFIQEGNLGLIRAVERFDHRRGFRFSTYAAWWIRHGFNRALADKARLVRVPVHMQDDAQYVARVKAQFITRTGRPATLAEIAQETGLTEEKVTFLEEHAGRAHPLSFDRPIGEDGDSTLLDVMAAPVERSPEEELDDAAWPDELRAVMGTLTTIEADVLRYRFGLDQTDELTLREIGDKYNLSRERIRQLQESALDKLRLELSRRQEEREVSVSAA